MPEEGHRGEKFQNGMGHGRLFIAAFGSGKKWGFLRRSSRHCPWMRTLKTSQLTLHPAKFIKVPMVGKKSENKAVGMSRGGNPLAFMLSSGNDHDFVHAVPLLDQVNIAGSNILGDKAYGSKAIREYITSEGAAFTIPPKNGIHAPWPVDWHTYKERHLVECFFQKIKWFRRVFTRYDKLDASFLAFVHIAAITILLK